MQLNEYLRTVADGYDSKDGFDTPQQELLRRAPTELREYGASDFVIRASGGQRPLRTTHTPWIGFFDPDESVTPQEGLYVVWLLRAPGDAWTLSVLMGTENRARQFANHRKSARSPVSREAHLLASLRTEADCIRRAMPKNTTSPWDLTIDLGSDGTRQRRYQAATVIGRTYPLSTFPDEEVLRADLEEMCSALHDAIDAKRELAVVAPGTVSTASATSGAPDRRELVFEPGLDRQTVVQLPMRSIVRKPQHESGLARYGSWLQEHGFKISTKVYPRDFVIAGNPGWLGEYKVVYGKDIARATREAHSQLKEYNHFIYGCDALKPGLLAVFSAPVTARRVSWLNAEAIAVVWEEDRKWRGCRIAREAGLAPR